VEKVAFRTDPAAEAAAIKRLLADRMALRARGEEARDVLRHALTPEVSAERILAAVRDWTPDRMLHASDMTAIT